MPEIIPDNRKWAGFYIEGNGQPPLKMQIFKIGLFHVMPWAKFSWPYDFKCRLDRLQNQGLRFVCGALRTTPTSACEIDSNIEPLRLRRERSTALTLERFKRMEEENPCRQMVDRWEPTERIKKNSFLKEATKLAESNNFPAEREISRAISNIAPHTALKKPKTQTSLPQNADKSTSPPILKLLALETIDNYPKDIIHAYTDGSAVRAVRNGGYGSVINNKHPCLGTYTSFGTLWSFLFQLWCGNSSNTKNSRHTSRTIQKWTS